MPYYIGAAPNDGWVSSSGWSYASATTINVVDGTLFNKGDKLKVVTTTPTTKYNYVVSIAANVLTVLGDGVENATMSTMFYSKILSPTGFPETFAKTITGTGFSGSVTGTVNYYIRRSRIYILDGYCVGTSNSTAFTITGFPIAIAAAITVYPSVIFGLDNSANIAVPLRFDISGTTMTLYTTIGGTGWTALNLKGEYAMLFDYAY